MTQETISKLNQINKDFYDQIGPQFDESRQYAWPGWEILWKFIIENKLSIETVLDIGCGNGRFYKFLQAKLNSLCYEGNQSIPFSEDILKSGFEYIGVDNNEYLIEIAKKEFSLFAEKTRFINEDVVMNFEPVGNRHAYSLQTIEYDMIVSFAVIHHIPSFEKRVEFLQNLKSFLKPDGLFVISIWKFLDDKSQENKIVDLTDVETSHGMSLQEINCNDLEQNDFLLSWNKGETAYRYCHYISDEEENDLINQSGLKIIKAYQNDGRKQKSNKYLILTK
jgi:SAM-dependent methyltransferase